MKPRVNFMIELTYPVKFYPKYDDQIRKVLGDWHGSGMGGNYLTTQMRDLCWHFMQNEDAAKQFFKRAKSKLKGLKLKIDLVTYNAQNRTRNSRS